MNNKNKNFKQDEKEGDNMNHSKYQIPTIFSRISPAIPTKAFETFWRFAFERQEIFFRRLRGENPPWTEDRILREYKFTNAYRASDRVSQYLIRNVIYSGLQTNDEIFFRIFLFKIFNRIETWEKLLNELGEIRYENYSFKRYDDILTRIQESGQSIYSAAYIMPSAQFYGSRRKHRNHLKLLELMMKEEVPSRIAEMRKMQYAFELIRSYPTLGNFLAFQLTIDINYSNITNFDEMEFIVPGPGARDGIKKCFLSLGGLNEANIIRLVAEQQHEIFEKLGLKFKTLWGRSLQLIDCQNLFCEIDKYSRLAHPEIKGFTNRTRIKQKYRINTSPIDYYYPPKWGINSKIKERSLNR